MARPVCGNTILSDGKPVDQGKCNAPCVGDGNEICGGSDALNLYAYKNYTFTNGPATIVSSYKCFGSPTCLRLAFFSTT